MQLKTYEILKNKVLEGNTTSILSIYEETTIDLAKQGSSISDIVVALPQFESIRSSLYRKRWSKYPKLPKTLADLVIDSDIYKNTLCSGQRFLLKDCYEKDHRIIIFSSDIQLKMLGNSKRIGVDGTFKTCADLFEQLYIIVCWYKGEVFPSAFVLLGSKTTETYTRMIEELKIAVLSLKLEFRPLNLKL